MKTKALDKVLRKHFPHCKAKEFSLQEKRHCSCGVEEARKELETILNLAPLCEEHGTGAGSRSGCPYCSIEEMGAALSRIDYLCGEPNDLEVSGYDIHNNPGAVVDSVKNRI